MPTPPTGSSTLFMTLPRSRPFFFFNDTATTEIYTLSLHDALPIYVITITNTETGRSQCVFRRRPRKSPRPRRPPPRSEEHTSELQSRPHLVCRLLLEKKKKNRCRSAPW